LFVSISQVIGCEDRLRNGLSCVWLGVKRYFKSNKSGPDWNEPLRYRRLVKLFVHGFYGCPSALNCIHTRRQRRTTDSRPSHSCGSRDL